MSNESMSLKVTGRLFHNFGAAMENALSPYVVVEDRGTTRNPDRRVRRGL